MYNGYYDNDNFDAAKFLDEQMGPALTKKGNVRKRKPKQPRIYFTEDTENAIVEYLSHTDQDICVLLVDLKLILLWRFLFWPVLLPVTRGRNQHTRCICLHCAPQSV